MNHIPTLNRRAFVIGTAAAGAGLAGLRPKGWRHRAHDAGAGRGQRLEGAGIGM